MRLGRLLREFTAPAPDPRGAYRDADALGPELLDRVRAALDGVAASRGQLEARADAVRERLPQLDEHARQALRAGRQDVARQALARRQIAEAELALLERQLGEADAEAGRLALVEQQVAARIDALAARERVLEARQSAAEAQVRVNEALAGISDRLAGLGPDLAQVEERTEEVEARAAAIDRLLDAAALDGVPCEDELEERLAALRRELAAP
jgi:phage shock protein A